MVIRWGVFSAKRRAALKTGWLITARNVIDESLSFDEIIARLRALETRNNAMAKSS
jgi:hypothetical protein